MKHLPKLKSPGDLKNLSMEELAELSEEIRQDIVSSVSLTGGHLATNLGSIELTVALHYAYDLRRDRLVWDVSNQTYGHKILTGRRDRMNTIRQYKGLAGFSKRSESEFDHFGAGHASTSISAALGFAAARDNAGQDHHVIAVIGDGAMTGGLAYEGLNNAGSQTSNFLVVLNDNSWSISKNVGAMSKYLTEITTDETFNKLRNEVWELTGKFKRRDKIRQAISHIESSIKGLLVPGMLFRKLGFRYFGPIDGHDLPLLIRTFQKIQSLKGPVLLHIGTTKGKGYKPAEDNPTKYHGVGRFNKETGEVEKKSGGHPSYTQVFGDTMVELGAKDKRVVAITAAMAPGTGLVDFSQAYPDRFYDVGIAEGHAGTFAAGLAAGGSRPYLTIYSTFMQRAFDMVAHDIALQKLPVVMCMDRAGLVGNDGPTHHGVFDLTYMSTLPDLVVAVPKDGNELRSMLHWTIENDLTGPVSIRYPRASVPTEMTGEIQAIEWGRWETLTDKSEFVVLATGTMVATALEAAERLRNDGTRICVVNARFVKPLDEQMLKTICTEAKTVVTIEENALRGGFGQAIADYLITRQFGGKFRALGIKDSFITHGDRSDLLKETGLDLDSVCDVLSQMAGDESGRAKEPNGLFRKLRLRRNSTVGKKKEEADPGAVGANKSR